MHEQGIEGQQLVSFESYVNFYRCPSLATWSQNICNVDVYVKMMWFFLTLMSYRKEMGILLIRKKKKALGRGKLSYRAGVASAKKRN